MGSLIPDIKMNIQQQYRNQLKMNGIIQYAESQTGGILGMNNGEVCEDGEINIHD